MGQGYTKDHASEFQGQILMGGGILRGNRANVNSTGNTHMDMISTLTISGTKDGLYRISRAGEGFYHGVTNIESRQKDWFPNVIIEGASHGSFMDETMLPSLVASSDLQPDITQAVAQ
jgi:hypothetical protein